MTSDWDRYRRHMSSAKHEIRRAVERASNVEMRHGHLVEATRLAMALRDAADELISELESSPNQPTGDDEVAPQEFELYYEGGTVDRHWVAPAHLSLTEAKEQRVGKLYKTRWGAQQALQRRQRRD